MIAEQLTLVDFKHFSHVNAVEYLYQVLFPNTKEHLYPNIRALTQAANSVCAAHCMLGVREFYDSALCSRLTFVSPLCFICS